MAQHLRWLIAVCWLASCAKERAQQDEIERAPQLPDDASGKSCKRDSECGQGRCARELFIGSATDASETPDGYCTLDCATDLQCGHGGECSVPANADMGECLATCQDRSACRDGYLCVGAGRLIGIGTLGTCQPRAPTGRLADALVGSACAGAADCEGGSCESTTPLGMKFPDNYCTARCDDDSQCGTGGACLVSKGSADAGWCFARCESDDDCTREGYRCREINPGFRGCYPAPRPLPDGIAGRACGLDEDCGAAANSCANELPYGTFSAYELVAAPGGYCTQRCSLDADCGAAAQCISHGAQGGMCLAVCELTSDCREGYVCFPHGRNITKDERVCVPRSAGITQSP
jgi:hypothetical protein